MEPFATFISKFKNSAYSKHSSTSLEDVPSSVGIGCVERGGVISADANMAYTQCKQLSCTPPLANQFEPLLSVRVTCPPKNLFYSSKIFPSAGLSPAKCRSHSDEEIMSSPDFSSRFYLCGCEEFKTSQLKSDTLEHYWIIFFKTMNVLF